MTAFQIRPCPLLPNQPEMNLLANGINHCCQIQEIAIAFFHKVQGVWQKPPTPLLGLAKLHVLGQLPWQLLYPRAWDILVVRAKF